MIEGSTTNLKSKNGEKISTERVKEKINQELECLDKGKLPICSTIGIFSHCAEDKNRAKVDKHFIFLYFFYNYNNKKNVLIVDPQGFNHLNSELVNTINNAAKENNANVYFSQDAIRQSADLSGKTCFTLFSTFNSINKETLLQNLEKGDESRRLSDSQENYVLCTLGDKIIPYDLISHIIAKEQKNDVSESLEAKGKKKDKKKSSRKKEDKKVKPQLDDGRIKDPKEQLSNAEQRAHQHTRENVKHTDQNHDKCTKTQGNRLQKFNPCLTFLISVCVFGAILFSLFLCTGVTKKEVNITGLCTLLIILACTVLAICLIKSREQKVGPKIDDLSVQTELQPIRNYN